MLMAVEKRTLASLDDNNMLINKIRETSEVLKKIIN
jgi:hypothetical protein